MLRWEGRLTDDPPRPSPRDVSYRSHHEMQEVHDLLVRRYASVILRSLLEATAAERDMAHGVCAAASRRLWHPDVQPPFGWPLLVRDYARWALANPSKAAL